MSKAIGQCEGKKFSPTKSCDLYATLTEVYTMGAEAFLCGACLKLLKGKGIPVAEKPTTDWGGWKGA